MDDSVSSLGLSSSALDESSCLSELDVSFETDKSSLSTYEDLDTSCSSAASADDVSDSPDSSRKAPNEFSFESSHHHPLYDGAKLSTWDSYLLIMKYALRHSLTKQAVKDLLDLVGMHLPTTSMMSLYRLKKFFLNLYEDISFSTHCCCSMCHSPLDDADATCRNGCDSDSTHFLTISVEAQLKRKLEGKTLCSIYKLHQYFHVYVTAFFR